MSTKNFSTTFAEFLTILINVYSDSGFDYVEKMGEGLGKTNARASIVGTYCSPDNRDINSPRKWLKKRGVIKIIDFLLSNEGLRAPNYNDKRITLEKKLEEAGLSEFYQSLLKERHDGDHEAFFKKYPQIEEDETLENASSSNGNKYLNIKILEAILPIEVISEIAEVTKSFFVLTAVISFQPNSPFIKLAADGIQLSTNEPLFRNNYLTINKTKFLELINGKGKKQRKIDLKEADKFLTDFPSDKIGLKLERATRRNETINIEFSQYGIRFTTREP